MCIQDHDPVLFCGKLFFQPLVERRFRLPADHLPNIRPVLQDAPDGGRTPALPLDIVPGTCADPALVPLWAFHAASLQLFHNSVDRYLLQFPPENLADGPGGFFIDHIGGLILVPEVAVGEVAVPKGPRFHLRPECRGDLFGYVPGIDGVHQVLEAHRQCFRGAAGGEAVKVLLDGDEPRPQRRENLFQVVARLHIVAPESAEVTDYDALYLPGPHIVHQAVPRRTVEHSPRPAVVGIYLREPEPGAFVQVIPADIDLVL